MTDLLPLDDDPAHWQPDLDDIEMTPHELAAEIAEGNRQGEIIEVDDDLDNGLDR